ncbi:DUF4145 domain-containing protein [Vibrio splendidus]|uniref:DUF4145 domain-containing protein n=1 Tax=Vibrio splendidus TaxID=29497 RepID=UPI00352D7C32
MDINYLFSLFFIAIAFVHQFWDEVTIDTYTLILLVIAAIPWFFPYLKSLELPGGFKVETKDALEKVEALEGELESSSTLSYEGVDSSLAFVALRVEIEKTVMKYQDDLGRKKHSLSIRLQVLANDGVISKALASALLEIVKLGNAAAHGQSIDSEEAELILMRAGSLIDKLDSSLAIA